MAPCVRRVRRARCLLGPAVGVFSPGGCRCPSSGFDQSSQASQGRCSHQRPPPLAVTQRGDSRCRRLGGFRPGNQRGFPESGKAGRLGPALVPSLRGRGIDSRESCGDLDRTAFRAWADPRAGSWSAGQRGRYFRRSVSVGGIPDGGDRCVGLGRQQHPGPSDEAGFFGLVWFSRFPGS